MRELSKDQEVIYNEVIKRKIGSILITGHAGTGKTFTAIKILEHFGTDPKDVLCIAPTHQAKLQFSSSLPEDFKVSTIASFLNVRASKNEITGEVEFSSGRIDKEKSQYKLIVIDECSMIGEEDLKELSKLEKNTLLLFLGDFNQLSPVKKKDGSEIFDKMTKYNLTTQHRNSGDILKLCDKLRDKEIYPTESSSEITVYDNKQDFLVELINRIQNDPDPYNISYLAFTNKAVKEVRNLIHTVLYGQDGINIGQYLRLDSRTEIGNKSEIIEVLGIELSKRNILETQVTVYTVLAENTFTGETARLNLLDYIDQDTIEELIQDYQKESYEMWSLHKKNPHMEQYKRKWKEVREKLNEVDNITFVTSPFALTIHKSQGRTIPTVFLDTQNIKNYGRDMKKKLLYVGCSRTKDSLNTIRV